MTTYKIIEAMSSCGYGLDDRIASCYEDSIEFTAETDAEAYRTAECLQSEHDKKARKVIDEAPYGDKYDLEESYNNAPCYTAHLWRCDDDEDVQIESDPSFKLSAWIRICSDPRVGESVAVNDDDQLRAQMRDCGWTEEDWDCFINDENERPTIVDAKLVELIASDEAVYETDDGEFFRVWDNGEVSYLKDGWETKQERVFDALWSCYEGISREEVFDNKAAFWADVVIDGEETHIETDHVRLTSYDLIPSEDERYAGLTYAEVAAIIGQEKLDEAIDRCAEGVCREEANRW